MRNSKRMKNKTKIILAIIALILLTISPFYIIFYQPEKAAEKLASNINSSDNWTGEGYSDFAQLEVVNAKEFLISTTSKLASDAGGEVLAKGGNAIDAAIAAQMVLNVVEPQSSGIGGGVLMLYYDAKTKQTIYFNGRETAPAAANSKIFLNENGEAKEFNDVVRGGLSVGVPGLLKALKAVHNNYGKLPWQELFEPAIKIAEDGFAIDAKIYVIIRDLASFKDNKSMATLYLKEDGTPKDIGTIITNPQLAKTLKIIAAEGIEPFYNGKIGEDIITAVKSSPANPGYLSADDLRKYQIKTGDLICGNYRVKYKICSMPLPSSGGITLLQILGILENFDLNKMLPNSLATIHLITEATRLAYADRNQYIGDNDNVPVAEMLGKNYLKKRAKLIDQNKALEEIKAGEFANIKTSVLINNQASERPSTTHLSIIDKEGNAIAMTSSIEYLFGSTLMVDGFMLNNQLTDFSFIDEIDGKQVANRLEPGKQPRSSSTPVFVFDDQDNLIMTVGSPGGPRIIQYVLKTILNVLEWDMDIQSAISAPNYVVINDVVELEKRTELENLAVELHKLGHRTKIVDVTSGITGITIATDDLGEKIITGGADPRRAGAAVGD